MLSPRTEHQRTASRAGCLPLAKDPRAGPPRTLSAALGSALALARVLPCGRNCRCSGFPSGAYLSRSPNRMAYRWLYSFDGSKTAYYQQGKYLYSAKTNQCDYYQSGEYIYHLADSGSRPVLYIRDNNVNSMDGQALYYYE